MTTQNKYKLSRMQQYMLKKCLLPENELWIYHTQFSYFLKIDGLVLPLFFKAVKSVQDSAPVLKTAFIKNGEGDEWNQIINETLELKIQYKDISDIAIEQQSLWIKNQLLQDRNNSFDIGDVNSPLIRTFIYKRDADKIHLTMSISHCIWDGWSHAVFLKEIFEQYHKLKQEPAFKIQNKDYDYIDFLALETKIRDNTDAQNFWENHLINWTSFRPVKHELVVNYDEYHHIEILLPDYLAVKIFHLQKENRVTLKSIFLAAFYRIIFEETKQGFATIGVVTNGRSFELTNPLTILGLLWNISPVCIEKTDDDFTLLKNVNRTISEVNKYGSYPLLDIMESKAVDELFHAAFNFINFEGANILGSSSDIELLEIEGMDKFHFPLHLLVGKHPFNKSMSLAMNFDTRCYGALEMELMLKRYVSVLEAMCYK